MRYRGRFAPSPTGLLHFGSLLAAVGSWLCAKHAGGEWLLRIEDIDPPREVTGSASEILAALPRFGLLADAPALFQSHRLQAYDTAFEQLRAQQQVFPCWCSRKDLADAQGMHRDGRCIRPAQRHRQPAWRMRTPNLDVAFNDGLQGKQRQNLRESAGDFVIRRSDGIYAYQLACVVDDAYQGITEVVRGSDLLESTPRQIWLQRCLGLMTPAYRHLPLVLDEHGRKLSKSDQARPVDPEHPLAPLRQVLHFLQLPVDPLASDVHTLLEGALADFNTVTLPQCSTTYGR